METMEESNICLMVLIGLPGAGKSFFCQNIVKTYQDKFHPIYICFDSLIPLTLQEEFARMKILEDDSSRENSDVNNWKSARQEVLIMVGKLVVCLKNGNVEDTILSYFRLKSIPRDEKYLIILDDNFYYRSMRYEYYQMARLHTLSFCQVYMECETGLAMQRNELRSEKVPRSVIEAMASKLQPPSPSKHTWENQTIIIKPNSNTEFDTVWELVTKSFTSPIQKIQDNTAEVEESRLKCSLSVVHQADLTLRNIVGAIIKETKENNTIPPAQMKRFSKEVNTERQNILTDLREGNLKMPAHLAEEIHDGNREELRDVLRCEVERVLKVKNILM